MTASYIDYIEANCKLLITSPVGRELYSITNGKPCNGCCYDEDRSCFRRPAGASPTANAALPPRKEYEETVKQEAARRGVSISQVRRERSGGQA